LTISILGTVGLPANYGGFETLAENLVHFHQVHSLEGELTVYCSAGNYPDRPANYLGAVLRYIRLNANGVSSIGYDIVSLFSAVWHRSDVILLLGVSGAISLPLIRLFSRARIVTNVDGVEWKRNKWKGAARWFLRLSERMAVRYSHEVVADNAGIAEHIKQSYGRNAHVIAYGGDHALQTPSKSYDGLALPQRYGLALCRIEPENNVAMILEAFASNAAMPLVFVGNWNNSAFGRELRQRYADYAHLYLLDPIYDVGVLRTLRGSAAVYVHGHSAGGTNPSLVEMMHFGLPILAYDCIFNRYTTENSAIFFKDSESLFQSLVTLDTDQSSFIGAEMRRIAQNRYRWDAIGQAYFELLLGEKFESKKSNRLLER
jgi:glycosyltransferase involved in cell wall biosynthesis